jgi:hypothetical protein
MNTNVNLTAQEAEVLCLESALDGLDELVNNLILRVQGKPSEAQVSFHDSVHQQLFNVLLLDFLKPMSPDLSGATLPALDCLGRACDAPLLNPSGGDALRLPLEVLTGWLDTAVSVPVHLPSIGVDGTISIRRREFIEICGNIGKHNFARLTRVAAKLAAILVRNGILISTDRVILALDDFYERFHTDILNYHGTTIVEMLNDLCWAIHDYLEPVFQFAYTSNPDCAIRYTYKYPEGVRSELTKEWFWSLMNRVRRGPYVPRFKGTGNLKKHY